MRLRLSFAPGAAQCVLPVHYNHVLQAFLYRHLDGQLAQSLHDEGFTEGKRHLKLFTFSRLQGEAMVRGDSIVFPSAFSLVVASPDVRFLESLALHLIQARALTLADQSVLLTAVEVETDPPYQDPVHLRALSPISVYSTLTMADGRRKTYYYSPWESEFSQSIVRNLQRKYRVYANKEVSVDSAYVSPVRVSKRNEHIVLYKGTVIKAWSGIYEVSLPEPLFRMALDAGLGSKNSQGFGCVGVYERRTQGVIAP